MLREERLPGGQPPLLTHLLMHSSPRLEPEAPYWGRSCPGCCWPSVGQRGVRMEAGEDGGSQRSCRAVPSARLSCVALGPPHHPSREQDPFWTLSRRQCRKAGRQAVGGALQREPRPDCATCTGVSGPWKPIFLHLPNWAVMSTQPSSPSCCSGA